MNESPDSVFNNLSAPVNAKFLKIETKLDTGSISDGVWRFVGKVGM
jgi:hypothetical protein